MKLHNFEFFFRNGIHSLPDERQNVIESNSGSL